jgi:hypothetical protein
VVRVLRPGGLLLLVGSAWDLPYSMPPSLPSERRLEVAARRLARQLRSWIDGHHRFDIVREPRVLTEGFVPDADAVHVTQSYLVCRFLEAAGMEIVKWQSLPYATEVSVLRRLLRGLLRLCPLWRNALGNLLVVARRGATAHRPPYEVQEL